MSPFDSVNDEITRFFESLGYGTSWDFERKSGARWYEVLKDDVLVAQIDMHAPLADLIEDMSAWHEGKPSPDRPGSADYGVYMPEGEDADELLAKVAASRAAGTANPKGTST